MSDRFKTEIEWRSDISAAPKDRRILMIAIPIVPSQAGGLPDLVVSHWYEGTERWVTANVEGESRPRLELRPMYWAEFRELPPGVKLRPLTFADFKG